MDVLGRLAEDDRLRRFEVGEPVAAELDDLVRLNVARAGLQRDERARRFAPLFVRPRDDGGVLHRWVFVENAFDFDGRDILSTGDDDVFRAVAELDVAVRVHDA